MRRLADSHFSWFAFMLFLLATTVDQLIDSGYTFWDLVFVIAAAALTFIAAVDMVLDMFFERLDERE